LIIILVVESTDADMGIDQEQQFEARTPCINEDTLRDKRYIFRVVEKFFLTLSSKEILVCHEAQVASG